MGMRVIVAPDDIGDQYRRPDDGLYEIPCAVVNQYRPFACVPGTANGPL